MKRILISILLYSLTLCAMQNNNNTPTMRSHPDNDRTVDLKLTWHILSEDIDNLPDSDPKVIASYCAVFRNCNNRISNLAPDTATYLKNPNAYTLTPIIRSMACEKHIGSTVSLLYTTQKGDQAIESTPVRLDFDGDCPLTCKDPTNPTQHMHILLSEIKKDEEKK